jgi:hypothetical protein
MYEEDEEMDFNEDCAAGVQTFTTDTILVAETHYLSQRLEIATHVSQFLVTSQSPSGTHSESRIVWLEFTISG